MQKKISKNMFLGIGGILAIGLSVMVCLLSLFLTMRTVKDNTPLGPTSNGVLRLTDDKNMFSNANKITGKLEVTVANTKKDTINIGHLYKKIVDADNHNTLLVFDASNTNKADDGVSTTGNIYICIDETTTHPKASAPATYGKDVYNIQSTDKNREIINDSTKTPAVIIGTIKALATTKAIPADPDPVPFVTIDSSSFKLYNITPLYTVLIFGGTLIALGAAVGLGSYFMYRK